MRRPPTTEASKYIDGPRYADVDDADLDEHAGAELPEHLTISADLSGERLDKALAARLPQVSRSRIQQWIEADAVQVNGVRVRPRHIVVEGDRINLQPLPAPEAAAMRAEPIPLAILYEDDDIAVIDKPPGLVVHPGAGNWSGTLANGLLAHHPAAVQLPRAGIVHRLDAETSGLMVVARSRRAYTDLVRQLQARSVRREYWAVVAGAAAQRFVVDAPIERDPRQPLRMCVSRRPSAKPARTQVARIATVEQQRATLSWVACRLETGRTHQIRVHLESVGLPLVGDPVYSRGRPTVAAAQRAHAPAWQRFARQALHACRLGLIHPATEQAMEWFQPPPQDLRVLMQQCGFAPGNEHISPFESISHDSERS